MFVFAAVWLGACASGTPSSGDTGSTGSLMITPPTLPTGVVSVAYNSPAFNASGGSGSGYTFALATGSISPLSIGASTGVISGTPTTTRDIAIHREGDGFAWRHGHDRPTQHHD